MFNKDIGHYHPGYKKQTTYSVKEGFKIPFTKKMIVTNECQIKKETTTFPTQGCAPDCFRGYGEEINEKH
jgi:hypothetical protein|tara:strand:+ start:540 stop:749 length:210 start_codon:yes stop_codon:yes gene_type:complete